MSSESKVIATAASSLGTGPMRIEEWHPDNGGFFAALFRLLDELEVRYCILRQPEPQTHDSPSACELAVHPEDRGRVPLLIESLRKEGYLPIQHIPLAANDSRYDFASSLEADTRFFSLIFLETFPSGHFFARDGEVFARRKKQRGLWVLGDADEFHYLLSRIGLEGKIDDREQNRLKQLVKLLGPSIAGTIVAELFGKSQQQRVLAACACGQWDGIQDRLGTLWQWTTFLHSPLKRVVHELLQFRCMLRRWSRPNGLYIVVLGPDGAGKSTLTEKLFELLGVLFHSGHVLQWRPQILKPRPRINPGFNPPHTKAAYGPLRSMLQTLAALVDYWVAYPAMILPLMAHRALIVFDRDLHDLLVDHKRYRYGGPDWFPRLAVRLCPAPETVFLTLDAEPDVILSRKNEVAPEELWRQRGAYADLAASLRNSSVIRTDSNFEASISAIMTAVLTFMANRFERRQTAERKRAARVGDMVQRVCEKILASLQFPPRASTSIHGWNTLKLWVLKCSTAIMDHGLISLSNFLLGVVLARYLGSEQYGAFALAFSTFVLLSLIHSALAMEPMSVFAPSIYRKTLREYLGLLLRVQLIGTLIIIACVGVGGMFSLLMGEHSRLVSAFEGIAIASPCVLIFWFARRAFYLQMRPGQALIGSFLYSAVLCLGIWGLASNQLLSPFACFVVMGAAAILTSLLLLFVLRPTINRKAIAKVVSLREVALRHWEYGRWAFASALFIWVPWNMFYSVVAHYSGLAGSGSLKALLNLAMPMTQTYAAFSLLFISQAARLGHDKGWEAVKHLAWKIAGLYTLGSSAYWILICIFRAPLIRLMYAGHYQDTAPLVPVIAVASILSGAAMGPTIAIRAMRSPASVAAIYLGSSVVCVVVGIPACRAWGVGGAVIGILLSSVSAVSTGFLMIRSRKLHERLSAPSPEQLSPNSISISS